MDKQNTPYKYYSSPAAVMSFLSPLHSIFYSTPLLAILEACSHQCSSDETHTTIPYVLATLGKPRNKEFCPSHSTLHSVYIHLGLLLLLLLLRTNRSLHQGSPALSTCPTGGQCVPETMGSLKLLALHASLEGFCHQKNAALSTISEAC